MWRIDVSKAASILHRMGNWAHLIHKMSNPEFDKFLLDHPLVHLIAAFISKGHQVSMVRKTKTIEIPFSDDRDSFRIDLEEPGLVQVLNDFGPKYLIDIKVAEFYDLNQKRGAVLKEITQRMANLGFIFDDWASDSYWFGQKERQYEFWTDSRLSKILKEKDSQKTIRDWFELYELPLVPMGEEKVIQPQFLPNEYGLFLPGVREYDLSQLAKLAREVLANFVPKLTEWNMWRYWESPSWYRQGGDVWADDSFWKDLASKNEKWNVLAFYGDLEARERMLEEAREFRAFEPEYCVYEGLLTRLEVWQSLEVWPNHCIFEEFDEMGCWPKVLGHMPAERARFAAAKIASLLIELKNAGSKASEDQLSELFCWGMEFQKGEVGLWFNPSQMERAKQICVSYAQKPAAPNWVWNSEYFEFALVFGGAETAVAMEGNANLENLLAQDVDQILHAGPMTLQLAEMGANSLAFKLAATILGIGQEEAVLEKICPVSDKKWPRFWFQDLAQSGTDVPENRVSAAITILRMLNNIGLLN
ncbi:MAG: hypothetical protein KDC71_21480 [Acidobacteria bacterium]|nr:hypothetical protein [Acidobacteriota bacterium]